MPAIPTFILPDMSQKERDFLLDVMRMNCDASGIIVVEIDPENGDCVHYLAWSAAGRTLVSFKNETVSEDPRTFPTRAGAAAKAKRLSEQFPGKMFTVAIWWHPDIHLKPMAKYQKMTGGQFPGSPRK
jgi:hypothetical protein